MKKILLLFFFLIFLGFSGAGKKAAFFFTHLPVRDTIVFAESRKEVRIDKSHPSAIISLRIDFERLKKSHKLYIRFDSILLERPPEGIYEVYLEDTFPVVRTLVASSPSFVHTINTYYLSGLGPGQQLMNAGRQLVKFQKSKNSNGDIFLVIIFQGNLLANHSVATDAGILRIRSVRLVSP